MCCWFLILLFLLLVGCVGLYVLFCDVEEVVLLSVVCDFVDLQDCLVCSDCMIKILCILLFVFDYVEVGGELVVCDGC